MAARWSSENVVVEFRDSQVTGPGRDPGRVEPGGVSGPQMRDESLALIFCFDPRYWKGPFSSNEAVTMVTAGGSDLLSLRAAEVRGAG